MRRLVAAFQAFAQPASGAGLHLEVVSRPYPAPQESGDKSPHSCASERTEPAGCESPPEFGLNLATESHCVSVRRGGKQREVNEQSVREGTRFGLSSWRACE